MSSRSELRAVVAAVGALGNRVYSGLSPEMPKRPYAVIDDGPNRTQLTSGDGRTTAWRQQHTVHLWEERATESEALETAVINAIDGTPTAVGTRFRVLSVTPVPDEDEQLVHKAVTVSLARQRV